jgi:XTP/dITP diphosphohydrolase
MAKLVIATHNRDKVKEFEALLNGLGVELLTLDSFATVAPVVEDADTLEGNALKKAREVFKQSGMPTVADDTGLEVHYLNDEPGIYSSRYAGPEATYADNCRKLLERMRGVPPRRRAARFRCVLAFVAPEGVVKLAEGECRGVITEFPRGANGFGYDPVFLPIGHNQTFGEMEAGLKNKVSHRGRAMEAMSLILREHYRLPQ